MPQREQLLPAVVVFAVALILVPSVADVDLWGHLQFGRDIVATRALSAADPYSFTADRPWVNHEWLAEVLMYGAYAGGGAAGLTALRLIVVGVMLAAIAYVLRRRGVTDRRRLLALAFAAIITYTRTQHVRPQLFSVALFALLLVVLDASRDRRRALWLAPGLMILWVNVHGGWIVGLAVLGLWTATHILRPACAWEERRQLALVLAATTAATLVNPYGAGLWTFLYSTVGLGRPDISEWHPIWDTPPGVMLFWVVTAAAAAVGLMRAWRRGAHAADLAIVLALGILSARVSRLDAFFAVAVATLLAPHFTSARDGVARERRTPQLRARTVGAAIACALALQWPAVAAIDLRGAQWLPEADAVRFVQERQLRGNMFTYFDWGEYAIWHLSPAIKVSIDGRRETVYGPGPIANHLAVYRNRKEAAAYLRALDPDFVWLPNDLSVVGMLRSSGEWTVVYEGVRSIVLAKHPLPPDERARPDLRRDNAPDDPSVRVFPGP